MNREDAPSGSGSMENQGIEGVGSPLGWNMEKESKLTKKHSKITS